MNCNSEMRRVRDIYLEIRVERCCIPLLPRSCPARHFFPPCPALTCSRHAHDALHGMGVAHRPCAHGNSHTLVPASANTAHSAQDVISMLRTNCELTLWHSLPSLLLALLCLVVDGPAACRGSELASAEAVPAFAGDLQSKA